MEEFLKKVGDYGKIMNQMIGEVKDLLPNVLDKKLPDMTGPSIPTPPKQEELRF